MVESSRCYASCSVCQINGTATHLGETRQLLVDLGTAALSAPGAVDVSDGHLATIRQGASAFVERIADAPALEWHPSNVPSSCDFTAAETALGKRLLALGPHLPWQPARQDPQGQDRALLAINSMFDLGDLIAGFVLVRPGSFYPEHSHPPQELYLTVEGTAEWRYGGSDEWHQVDPGVVFYNPPSAQHGQRNHDSVNVSLYVLWP